MRVEIVGCLGSATSVFFCCIPTCTVCVCVCVCVCICTVLDILVNFAPDLRPILHLKHRGRNASKHGVSEKENSDAE